MSKITLRDYQKEAVEFALNTKKCQLLMKTGTGKTLIALIYLKTLLKRNLTDKVIISCTKTSTVVFQKEFMNMFNYKVQVIEKADDFIDFLNSNGKVCVVKHSMFKNLGSDLQYIKELKQIYKEKKLKISLIIDEAHKISNDTGVTQKYYNNIVFLWDRIVLCTATPYSSSLTQLYGLVQLIHPKLWSRKSDFEEKYIDYLVVRDKVNWKKVLRKEILRYKNLDKLRKEIEPFTFFYYPPTKLNFYYHKARLKDYSEYDLLAKGLISLKSDEEGEKE